MITPDPVFHVFCPALNRTVVLRKKIWIYKILGPAGHQEMRGKQALVQRVVQSAASEELWICRHYPPHKPFIQKMVGDFLMDNKFLRVGLEIVDSNTAVITTALAVNTYPRGVMRYV